jgi:diguanylate cyclase (GGDEF)-like protein
MDSGRIRMIVPVLRHAGRPAVAGLAYFVLAAASIAFVTAHGGIAPIWPANALVLAFMLLRPAREAAGFVAAGAIANVAAVLVTGGGLAFAFASALADGAELAVTAIGIMGRGRLPRNLASAAEIARILLWAGLIAPAVGAAFGALACMTLLGQALGSAYLSWFLSDALGLLIFTPLFTSLMTGEIRAAHARMTVAQRVEFAALLAFTMATAALVFFAAPYPLLFLIVVPLMLVTFRAGWAGTKIALAIVAIIAALATLAGLGPIAAQVADGASRAYGVQIFIATMILILLPIASTLAARQQLIDRLRESEQSLRLLAARSPILLLAFDLEGRCDRVVGTSDILLDRATASLVGATMADISQEGQFALRRAHNAALDDIERSHPAEFRTVKARDAWYEAVFRAHFDETGRCVGTIATIHEITERKNQELSLSRTATTDSLTGLLNRAGFHDRLEHALVSAGPGALSLAVVDVDRFKLINDNSGHQVGDLVLREIARRISGQVRSSDAVGRLGGDEFVILLATPHWDVARDICDRIVAAVSAEPIALPSGNTLRAAISCGVARLREGSSAEAFIHEADTALYEAKRAGRNRVVAA